MQFSTIASGWRALSGLMWPHQRTLTPHQADAVVVEEYARVRKQMPMLFLSLALCALAALIATRQEASTAIEFAIKCLILAYCLIWMMLWYRVRNMPITPDHARERHRTHLMFAVAFTLPVLASTASFAHASTPASQIFAAAFLALGSFCASNCLASHPPTAVTPLLGAALPASLLLLISGDQAAIGVGLSITTVVILNIRLIIAGHCEMVSSICLRLELETQARTDPLTGLPNRRAFNERLAGLVTKGEPFTLAVIDLDGFKPVNDRFGHQMGDLLLQAIAMRIGESLPAKACVSRLGGDEFALLICDAENVGLEAADRALTMLAIPFAIAGRSVMIGASMGLARFPAKALTAEALMAEADSALYRAKSGLEDSVARPRPHQLRAATH